MAATDAAATSAAASARGEALPSTSTSTSTSSASGGSISWFDSWYPVAFVKDLDKAKPHRVVLLGIPMVVWWDKNAGAWRVLEDVCPHRLVPLSEGRITPSGLLECGYHGWAFSGDGKCEVIPQQGKSDTPRACATGYHCAVRQGLLFVLPKPLPPALRPSGGANEELAAALAAVAEEESRIPLVSELDEPGGKWLSQDVWRDLPYDWSTLMENVLDSSHVPFTHHASMSNRNVIGPYDIKLTTAISEAGFSGLWKTGPRAGKLGPQSTTFVAPSFMKHRLDSKGFASLTVVYAVPMEPGRCRLINRNVLRFNNAIPEAIFGLVPAWWWHVSSHLLLEDDQIFLHLGEEETARRRAGGLGHSQVWVCYMPSQADTYVIAFQRWLARFGGGGPFGGGGLAADGAAFVEALGPRLSRKQLLDRYSQHTETCASCQQGLKQVGGVAAVARAVTVAAGAAAVFCAAVAVAAAGAAATGAGTVAAAGTAAGGGAATGAASVLSAVGSALVAAAGLVAGPYDPTGVSHMLRAAMWAVLAAAAAAGGARAEALRKLFFEGVYPPPRNLKD
ncbi:hypothetical protein HYH02_005182 [Chlamydomonas schloesseri]|uniref:Rieske domain-containing protein n=1 Tax=Chlamydomonas schloesseri TaxID=2026947 RepID=A0A835WLH2_9CHLO|nr:hypothetical protein HYH02_005182 [Chlamydomonas schloesseri]|eukprot:KAG2449650.1 hypothetical protein HYH02_005182 [Chlamydomonas schloesseri]